MYAIIETGGKQYRVTEGQALDIERLGVDEGGTVELDRVLLLADDSNVTTGKPYIEGAKVMATVKENGRSDKIIVFKFKSKVRYRRKMGHRQLYTRLVIDKILPAGGEAAEAKPVKRARRTKKEVTADGA